MQAVPVGKTTVFGGSVTLVAFALAIVAYLQGARDEATLGTLAVGLVGLVGTLGGRYGQAIAALFARSSWGGVEHTLGLVEEISSDPPKRRSPTVPTEAEISAWQTHSNLDPLIEEPMTFVPGIKAHGRKVNPDPYAGSIPAGSVPAEGGQ